MLSASPTNCADNGFEMLTNIASPCRRIYGSSPDQRQTGSEFCLKQNQQPTRNGVNGGPKQAFQHLPLILKSACELFDAELVHASQYLFDEKQALLQH